MANDNQDKAAGSGQIAAIGGGEGTAAAWSNPDIVMSSPAGIAALTPKNIIISAGQTMSLTASHDTNLSIQGNYVWTVKDGISLFAYGIAGNSSKPNQETGIKLHAASGKVSLQSQRDETTLTADKDIHINSITQGVSISAAKHVLLTAMGAFIKLEGGNIEIHAPGAVTFKGTLKVLTGPKASSFVPHEFPTGNMPPNKLVIERLYHDKEPLVAAPYEVTFADGSKRKGTLDGGGRATLEGIPPGNATVIFGAMPGKFERKDQTPMPAHKAKPGTRDIDALIEKYSSKS